MFQSCEIAAWHAHNRPFAAHFVASGLEDSKVVRMFGAARGRPTRVVQPVSPPPSGGAENQPRHVDPATNGNG